MSTPINFKQIDELKILLSEERLKRFISLTGSDKKAIEFHQESLKIGASLIGIIATIEIALRNTITRNLDCYFGNNDWLQPGFNKQKFKWQEKECKKIKDVISSLKREKYTKLSEAEKEALDKSIWPKGLPDRITPDKASKKRQESLQINKGDIIARLTLHFWKRLYGGAYNRHGGEYNQTLWQTSLRQTFPNKKLKREYVASQLECFYKSRNRLAHHEPVEGDSFKKAIKAINFIVCHLNNPRDECDTPLASLLADDIEKIHTRGKEFQRKLTYYERKGNC